jgi:hypothetical protein
MNNHRKPIEQVGIGLNRIELRYVGSAEAPLHEMISEEAEVANINNK